MLTLRQLRNQLPEERIDKDSFETLWDVYRILLSQLRKEMTDFVITQSGFKVVTEFVANNPGRVLNQQMTVEIVSRKVGDDGGVTTSLMMEFDGQKLRDYAFFDLATKEVCEHPENFSFTSTDAGLNSSFVLYRELLESIKHNIRRSHSEKTDIIDFMDTEGNEDE